MTEIEAKFIVRRPEQIDEALRVLGARGYSISPRGESTHVDRYYDTDDWSLLAAGWACRIRRRHGHEKVTLKSLHGADANVHVRSEISQDSEGHTSKAALPLSTGPVRKILDGILGERPVVQLFCVTTCRAVFELEGPDPRSLHIELDIDECRIEAEKASEKATGVLQFTELELESKSGSAADLESLAVLLCDEAGLMPAHYSKFERGLQAAGLEMDALLGETQAAAIGEDGPVLTLLFRFLEQQLEIIRRQRPRALEGIDPEGVHQMRVATRRTRAIMKTFREMLGDATVAKFNAELRWLARNLGRARDADIIERRAKEAGETDAAHYTRFLEQETIKAYEHLGDALQSERYAALEHDLQQFVSAGPAAAMQERFGNLHIAECARRYIHSALATLLAHGKAIDADAPARELHGLRIEAKRFRYLLDFFGAVQADKWAQLTEAVKNLQDLLGEHQDAITAQAHLADYIATLTDKGAGGDVLSSTARLMRAEALRIAASRQQFDSTWSEFRELASQYVHPRVAVAP
ncbi:MAG TPA: CHAD domain-containing protein [Woeseiaceae bacterium]|nr:CHAD domain-containing protein [Woeseiaceae bacterium]